jgi:TetR/AcrR family fatty acid metabolism transcriptional regulator
MSQRNRSDKRERILLAAVKVFAAKGFYCARVSDVARAAGVADGTIYLYFSSKEELLRGLFEENLTRIIGQLQSLVVEGISAEEKLERLFEGYTQFTENEPELAEVLTVELRESGKFMNEFAAPLFGEFLRIVVDVLDAGQSAGEFRKDFSTRTIARAMFGALDELALSWVMSKRKWNLHQSGREVVDVFLRGMRVTSPGDAD